MSDYRKRDPNEISPTEIRNICEEILLEKKKVHSVLKWKLTAPQENILVRVRPGDFRRVISNLLDNSAEASRAGSEISMQVYLQRPESVELHIQDHGIGIPKDILGRIGEAGLTSGKGSQGTGLGVYDSYKKVEEWGGAIQFNSTENIGTTVTIRLPLSLKKKV